MELTKTEKEVLDTVLDAHKDIEGAHSIRVNGASISLGSSEKISIEKREDGKGIVVRVAPHTKNETIYIPVVISKAGVVDLVYNDFYIGEGAEVTIVAGCGIHSDEDKVSQHDGIHSFYLEKQATCSYIEHHIGVGKGNSKILNPVTNLSLKEEATMYIETVQLEGVTSTDRVTNAILEDRATLTVREKLLTTGTQYAKTDFVVELQGKGSNASIASRSVAKGESKQYFVSQLHGRNECMGHSECDAIIMDKALVQATPEVTAYHVDASLIHEAAIGKIAGEQIVKLMTLGMTEEEAEVAIIKGFLQ